MPADGDRIQVYASARRAALLVAALNRGAFDLVICSSERICLALTDRLFAFVAEPVGLRRRGTKKAAPQRPRIRGHPTRHTTRFHQYWRSPVLCNSIGNAPPLAPGSAARNR
jgi:hypothetical protein